MRVQKLLTAIRLNSTLSQVASNSTTPLNASFLLPSSFEETFKSFPQAIENTRLIAERCNLHLPLDQPHFPEIKLPQGVTSDSRLRDLAEKGAIERYGEISADLKGRLEHELKIIEDLGYAPLFLIVQQILQYARDQGIPISSRGSAASSLVAYCLGITTPDPIALNLYFERFLNPSRKSPPDIDTDLCSNRRDSVLDFVYRHFGQDMVAMVATINHFQPRSALREIAKIHDLPSNEIKKLVEALPYRGWGPISRRGSAEDPYREMETEFREPKFSRIFEDARSILKFPRHLSVHPGGVVISPTHTTDLVPTHLASKGILIAQFDHEIIERLGLVKIDLLGTRGLTVIGDVAEKIYGWQGSEYTSALDVLESIPEDDPETGVMVRQAKTIGCFQIESPGMRSTLREIDAHTPGDLMIALALYRPGPMTGGLKDAFVRRHLGKEEVTHIHPALSHLLEETYGVILYQEQVLLIASRLAGLSLADADLLRRAMSHFDPGERMNTLKMRFIQGAERISKVQPEIGNQIWDLMAAFAGYGFPKAHAASYATVSWRSAWCKCHYPAEFMTAVLAGWGGYYRQRVYLNEARRLGLPLRTPHINHAISQFSVKYPKGIPTLFMGLDQVRDLTRRTQQRILRCRPFSTFEDFLTRVDPQRKEVENLIRVGALDGLGKIPELLSRLKTGGWSYGQPPLFTLDFSNDVRDWDLASRVDAQLAILNASVDAHPLELYSDILESIDTQTTIEALSKPEDKVCVAGLRLTTQRFYAHQGEPYYILELEDMEGVLPVHLSPAFYRQNRHKMSVAKPFIIEGKMIRSENTGDPVLLAERILTLVK
jgi:DNA-directed DNA polymerase III PolC